MLEKKQTGRAKDVMATTTLKEGTYTLAISGQDGTRVYGLTLKMRQPFVFHAIDDLPKTLASIAIFFLKDSAGNNTMLLELGPARRKELTKRKSRSDLKWR